MTRSLLAAALLSAVIIGGFFVGVLQTVTDTTPDPWGDD